MILVQKAIVVKLDTSLALDRYMARYYHDLFSAGFPDRLQGAAGQTAKCPGAMGISPVVGRLTLAQEAEVRILDPQPSTGKPLYFAPSWFQLRLAVCGAGLSWARLWEHSGLRRSPFDFPQDERLSPYLAQEPRIRLRGPWPQDERTASLQPGSC